MKKSGFVAGVLAVLFLTGGCVFTSNTYVENAEFDLTLPAFKPTAPQIRLGVFKNLSGSDRRFLRRSADGRMETFEYLRWLLSPELLLQRCMYGAFAVDTAADSNVPLVGCLLYRFEFDGKDNRALLSADFVIRLGDGGSKVVRVNVSSPVKGEFSGSSGAAAMSDCAGQAVAAVAGALK